MSEETTRKVGPYGQDRLWHELYIELLADPFDKRNDKTFCDDIKLEYQTFCAWKSKYRKNVYAEANRRRQIYMAEVRTKNYKAIAANLDESFNDRKLMAQLTGDLVERTENIHEMTGHEDKLRRLNALLKNAAEKKKRWEDESASEQGTPTVDGLQPSGANKQLNVEGDQPREDISLPKPL